MAEQKQFLGYTALNYFWGRLKTIFVQKEDGKGLSTNDYTNEEKQKLAGLENYTLPTASETVKGGIKVGAGLSVTGDGILSATGGGTADAVEWDNVVGKPTNVSAFTNDAGYVDEEDVESQITAKGYQNAQQVETAITSKNYQTATQVESIIESKDYQTETEVNALITQKGYITSGGVDTKLQNYALKSDVSSALKYKGSKDTYSGLPSSGNEVGDVWNIVQADSSHSVKAGDNVAWNGTSWDVLSGTVDLSAYVQADNLVEITTGEIDNIIDGLS